MGRKKKENPPVTDNEEKVEVNGNIKTVTYSEVPEIENEIHLKTKAEIFSFVNEIKAICRKSLEYEDYTSYLRTNVGMDSCAFFKGISKQTNRKIKIEIHHTPLTLADIIRIVVKKAIATGEELNSLLLAEEVMELHYANRVGLIPLSKTLHELADNTDKLKIPIYMIYGNFKEFIKAYEDYIDEEDDIKAKIAQMIAWTKELKSSDYNVLEEEYTYLKMDGFEIPIRTDNVLELEKTIAENEAKKKKKRVA